MSDTVRQQLEKCKNLQYIIDDDPNKDDFKNFNHIVFSKRDLNLNKNMVKVIFANYIVNPYNGFDFHEKFNNGIPPYSTTMYGTIDKETEKMLYFSGHSDSDNKMWHGWCPKKSCTIIPI